MSSTGAGNIIITDIFAAWNASITTQQGDIIGVVCGAALEDVSRVWWQPATHVAAPVLVCALTCVYRTVIRHCS